MCKEDVRKCKVGRNAVLGLAFLRRATGPFGRERRPYGEMRCEATRGRRRVAIGFAMGVYHSGYYHFLSIEDFQPFADARVSAAVVDSGLCRLSPLR